MKKVNTITQETHDAILTAAISLRKEFNEEHDVPIFVTSIPVDEGGELKELRNRVFGSKAFGNLRLRPGVYDSTVNALLKDGIINNGDIPMEYEDAASFRSTMHGMRRMSVNCIAEECPICITAEYTSDVTICSNNGFVLRNGNEGLQQRDLKWGDLRLACPSVGWHYSSRQFKAFGRSLTLLDPDIKPEHNLAENELMYLSQLDSLLRGVIMSNAIPERPTTGTVAAKLRISSTRYKNIQVLPVSSFVGIAIAQPLNGVHRKRKRVSNFWDWRRHELGTQNEVVYKRTSEWKGVCAYCLLQITRNRSITSALVNNGEPDPIVRLHSNYLDDLKECAMDAESNRRLTIFVVEPVTDNYIEQLFRSGFNVER